MFDSSKQHRRHTTSIAQRAAGLGLGLALGASALGTAPVALADTGTVTTPIYVTPDLSESTTVDGYGDTQLKVVLPVGLSFRAATDGTLFGPSDGEARITNNSTCAVHVSKIKAEAESGFNLVGFENEVTAGSDVYLELTPGNGNAISLGSFTNAKRPDARYWDVAAGSSLGLNAIGGKIGSVTTLSPTGKTRVAAVSWTVAPGTADDAATAEVCVLIHCVTAEGTVTDLLYEEGGSQIPTLPAGYAWHKDSVTGEVVESVAAMSDAAINAGVNEVYLYGVAL